jgi:hypothetical protein
MRNGFIVAVNSVGTSAPSGTKTARSTTICDPGEGLSEESDNGATLLFSLRS